MDLSTITVADFKALFRRDFPYLPVYDAAALYNAGMTVYYPTTLLFYKCMVDGTTGKAPNENPTLWTKIPDDVDNYVLDEDIEKAFQEAKVSFNQGLFTTDANIKLGYLYLTAHYLCNDLKAARGGIMAQAQFIATGRTVGNVSEQYGIPQRYIDDPVLAFYTQSAYGLKYLAMVLPMLVGNVVGICGRTHA